MRCMNNVCINHNNDMYTDNGMFVYLYRYLSGWSSQLMNIFFSKHGQQSTIVNFFSSVAHVWVPGAKTTGPISIQ
jgi:hypothetical protein